MDPATPLLSALRWCNEAIQNLLVLVNLAAQDGTDRAVVFLTEGRIQIGRLQDTAAILRKLLATGGMAVSEDEAERRLIQPPSGDLVAIGQILRRAMVDVDRALSVMPWKMPWRDVAVMAQAQQAREAFAVVSESVVTLTQAFFRWRGVPRMEPC